MKKAKKSFQFSYFSKSLVFLIAMTAMVALAVKDHLLYQGSGVTKFQLFEDAQGQRTTVQTRQNYQMHRRFTQTGGDELFLVTSNQVLRQYLDAEGSSGSISWSVRKGPHLGTVLWGRTESATELNVHEMKSVVVSGLGGCCAEMTGYRLFDLDNGRLLMSFNNFSEDNGKVVQPFSLEVPNSPLRARYIGVLSGDSTRDRDFVDPTEGKQPVLLVKYSVENLKQKIQLDMAVADGYAPSVLSVSLEKDPSVVNSDKVEIRDLQATLWNIDGATLGKAITGVLLRIVVSAGNGEKLIQIPVKNDEFDLSAAQVPEGVSLQPIVQLRTF